MTLVFGRHANFWNFREFYPTPRKLGNESESFLFWETVEIPVCFCVGLSCFYPQHLILGSEYFRPGVLVCSDMWRVPVLGCSWVWFLTFLLPTEDVAATPTQMRGHLAQAQWSGLIPMEDGISIYPHEMTGCHPHFPPEMTGILSGSCTSFAIQERYPGAECELLPVANMHAGAGWLLASIAPMETRLADFLITGRTL